MSKRRTVFWFRGILCFLFKVDKIILLQLMLLMVTVATNHRARDTRQTRRYHFTAAKSGSTLVEICKLLSFHNHLCRPEKHKFLFTVCILFDSSCQLSVSILEFLFCVLIRFFIVKCSHAWVCDFNCYIGIFQIGDIFGFDGSTMSRTTCKYLGVINIVISSSD